MRYLVCRKEAVEARMKTSELFPCIVEASAGATAEEVVRIALNTKWPGYEPRNKSYYVVAMDNNALLVTFKPRQDYDIIVERA
jgi:hypothetical protein